MVLDILTVLFLVSGLLLIFFMVRERRGDVLYRHHVNKPSLVQAKVADSKFGGPPPRKMQRNSNAQLTSGADESHIPA